MSHIIYNKYILSLISPNKKSKIRRQIAFTAQIISKNFSHEKNVHFSLDYIIFYYLILFFYKIKKGHISPILKSMINNTQHTYDTRGTNIQRLHSRNKLCDKHFSIHFSKIWWNLPQNIVSYQKFCHFKEFICNFLKISANLETFSNLYCG